MCLGASIYALALRGKVPILLPEEGTVPWRFPSHGSTSLNYKNLIHSMAGTPMSQELLCSSHLLEKRANSLALLHFLEQQIHRIYATIEGWSSLNAHNLDQP